MAESRLHRELSEKALIWIASKSTGRGINANVEVAIKEGYCIDALALCRCYNSFEEELLNVKYTQDKDEYNKMMHNNLPDFVFAFEVKVTVQDFVNTFIKNQHIGDRLNPIGNFHFIVTPPKMLMPEQIPSFWGLLEKSGVGLGVKKMPKFCELYINDIHRIGYILLRNHKKYKRSVLHEEYEIERNIVKQFSLEIGKYIQYEPTEADINRYPHYKNAEKCWLTNDGKYEILLNKVELFTHLKIHRIDNKPIYNYMDFQEIKNDILGKDITAVEIYPKKTDFKNGSHTYHLWTWQDVDKGLPNLSTIPRYF